MRRVIVESPYGNRDPRIVARNVRYLVRCMRDCIEREESPYASHGLNAALGVLDDSDPKQRDKGIACTIAWRPVADACVVYMDYGRSKGMQIGIDEAHAMHLPVDFRTIGQNDVAAEEQHMRDNDCILTALALRYQDLDNFIATLKPSPTVIGPFHTLDETRRQRDAIARLMRRFQ